MMRPSPVPTLAELLEHQERVDRLSAGAGVALVIHVAASQERYAALELRLGTRPPRIPVDPAMKVQKKHGAL